MSQREIRVLQTHQRHKLNQSYHRGGVRCMHVNEIDPVAQYISANNGAVYFFLCKNIYFTLCCTHMYVFNKICQTYKSNI